MGQLAPANVNIITPRRAKGWSKHAWDTTQRQVRPFGLLRPTYSPASGGYLSVHDCKSCFQNLHRSCASGHSWGCCCNSIYKSHEIFRLACSALAKMLFGEVVKLIHLAENVSLEARRLQDWKFIIHSTFLYLSQVLLNIIKLPKLGQHLHSGQSTSPTKLRKSFPD